MKFSSISQISSIFNSSNNNSSNDFSLELQFYTILYGLNGLKILALFQTEPKAQKQQSNN